MPASASPSGRQTIIHDEETLARIKALNIPDSWRQVWISPSPEGHLQATGRDTRGRRQSKYHARWRDFRDENRFEQMLCFTEILPAMRARVEHDIDLPGMPREHVLAILIRLMDSAASGNGDSRKSESPHETENAKRAKSNTRDITWFQINGKGKKHKIDLEDVYLNRVVCEFTDMPGFELFQFTGSDGKRARIGCSDINDYVHSSTGGEFTARDFRTWGASLMTLEYLGQLQPPAARAEANKNVTEAVRRVSHRLSHTPAMCRKCLIHPAVIESYLGGTIGHWLDASNGANNGKNRHSGFLKLALHERCLFCLLEDWAARRKASTP